MGFDIGDCKSEILKILNILISCIWFGLIFELDLGDLCMFLG